MAQLEIRDESPRSGHQSVAVRRREDQHGRGEQRAASRCAVVLRPDHGVHGKSSGSHQLTKAWRLLFQAYSPKNNASLVVLMLVALAFSLYTNAVVAEAGDAGDVNAILKRSPKGASKGSVWSKDSEFVCWYEKR